MDKSTFRVEGLGFRASPKTGYPNVSPTILNPKPSSTKVYHPSLEPPGKFKAEVACQDFVMDGCPEIISGCEAP